MDGNSGPPIIVVVGANAHITGLSEAVVDAIEVEHSQPTGALIDVEW